MKLSFVEISLPFPTHSGASHSLPQHIETALAQVGEPLRWAIAAVSSTTIQVEAVVIQATNGEDH